jgi:hypothetical protein
MKWGSWRAGKSGSLGWVLALAGLLCWSVWGCSSRPSPSSEAGQAAAPATAGNASDPGIDLNCVSDRIQNPPEAFHYSYKKDGTSPVHEEADITPQTIEGSFENSSGSHAVHGVRSDSAGWQNAAMSLMGIAGMTSGVALVNHSSAMVREGPEKVNGYDSIRYSIDTGRGNSAEQGLYRATLGAGGFEKGTAWVTAQGCPVKMVLDSEMHSRDGSVEKIHYEEEMVRK